MKEFLCPTLELMIILPAMLLAYLPMKQHLCMRPSRLTAIAAPFIILLCLAGGSLCYFFSINTIWLRFFLAAIAGFFYLHTLHVSRWKSVSVFLAVCGSFSYLDSVANAINMLLYSENSTPWFSLELVLIYNLICWIFVGISWYPASHAARKLLEEDTFAQTWYVFWILPILFIVLKLFLTPVYPELLHQDGSIQLYIKSNLVLLFLLLLFYGMFYLIATSLNRNDRLRQENQFLSMQQTQYNNLQSAIAETLEARHDMRHHFLALQNLARRQEWEKLESYLDKVLDSLPDSELSLCDNPAADGVVSHYGLLCRKHNIPFSCKLDLPQELSVSEIDLCLVLSNLLENALEASLNTDPAKRQIRMQAYLHSGHMVLLTVKNTFDGTIKEKDGIFQSSKRRGEGVGIQSIRHIAEKNGGYSRFSYENGVFCANVMLRAEK